MYITPPLNESGISKLRTKLVKPLLSGDWLPHLDKL